MKRVLTILVPVFVLSAALPSLAVDPEGVEAMTKEERIAVREARRAEREAMTPEQREAARAERRARFEELSPEQRGQIRERMQNREHRGKGGRRGGAGREKRNQS